MKMMKNDIEKEGELIFQQIQQPPEWIKYRMKPQVYLPV